MILRLLERSALGEGATLTSVINVDICIHESMHRICPGAHMARSMIWISIASILRTMTISKARDETGEVVTPVLEFSSATIS